jgi:hypothetical protein
MRVTDAAGAAPATAPAVGYSDSQRPLRRAVMAVVGWPLPAIRTSRWAQLQDATANRSPDTNNTAA